MTDRPDARLVFLHRAAARLTLFKACLMDLDEAFDGLIPAFLDILEALDELEERAA